MCFFRKFYKYSTSNLMQEDQNINFKSLNKANKILHVITSLDVGGAECVLIDLANILYENGADISVCTIVNRGEIADKLNNGIEHFNIRRKTKFSLLTMYQFYKIAKNFQIIHVHLRYNLQYVWLVKKLFLLSQSI